MIFSTELFAAVVVAVIGGLIVWANPRRNVNRTVFICSGVVAGWLACRHLAITSEQGLFWLRWTCALGALVPLTLWMVKEGIAGTLRPQPREWIARNCIWWIGPVLLATLPFTESFIPSHSTSELRLRGWGYYTYYIGLVAIYAWLLRDSFRNMKGLAGAQRLELQVWLCGGCFCAAAIYILIGLSAVTRDPFYRHLQPLAVLVFYAGTGFAITTHRIFDARQILLLLVEKSVLVVAVATAAYALNKAIAILLPGLLGFIITIAVVLWFAAALNTWLDRKLKFVPQGLAARQAAFATAQQETGVEKLQQSYCALLKGWGQTDHALIVSGNHDGLSAEGVEIAAGDPVLRSLRRLRWATPERLARERNTPDRRALAGFLAKHALGVLVLAEGPSLVTMIGVGVSASRRPYTYPQVTRLMELASIIESALERAHFAVKVQHAEQLATVGLLGATFAHEIRNPLVSIKTFVQLLPTHYGDPAFREKFFRLIGDEVTRIDHLTEQLLDLASPRSYVSSAVDLHPVVRESIELIIAKASTRRIDFQLSLDAVPDRVFTDASAAKQVLLNLCFNAIQAVESHECDRRWVKIATRNTRAGVEIMVADSGPGISADIRPRLFQPFQTTKSSGFGLGLAICSDILGNLRASITVDPPAPGRGATFRVVFPCQPLSS